LHGGGLYLDRGTNFLIFGGGTGFGGGNSFLKVNF